jgi:hypothetical protein
VNAETLTTAAMNDRHDWARITHLVGQLRLVIDHTAQRAARENSAWHDDPEAEGHAKYHAPADVQFPRDVRDAAVLELVRHYLTEITLSEQARPA